MRKTNLILYAGDPRIDMGGERLKGSEAVGAHVPS